MRKEKIPKIRKDPSNNLPLPAAPKIQNSSLQKTPETIHNRPTNYHLSKNPSLPHFNPLNTKYRRIQNKRFLSLY
jgi:hypothetical protein